jgi:hypothetical protein
VDPQCRTGGRGMKATRPPILLTPAGRLTVSVIGALQLPGCARHRPVRRASRVSARWGLSLSPAKGVRHRSLCAWGVYSAAVCPLRSRPCAPSPFAVCRVAVRLAGARSGLLDAAYQTALFSCQTPRRCGRLALPVPDGRPAVLFAWRCHLPGRPTRRPRPRLLHGVCQPVGAVMWALWRRCHLGVSPGRYRALSSPCDIGVLERGHPGLAWPGWPLGPIGGAPGVRALARPGVPPWCPLVPRVGCPRWWGRMEPDVPGAVMVQASMVQVCTRWCGGQVRVSMVGACKRLNHNGLHALVGPPSPHPPPHPAPRRGPPVGSHGLGIFLALPGGSLGSLRHSGFTNPEYGHFGAQGCPQRAGTTFGGACGKIKVNSLVSYYLEAPELGRSLSELPELSMGD